MKISVLGEFSLTAVPSPENPEIYNITLGAEHRREVINMKTNKDETADQFCLRIRGMMRALIQAESREIPVTLPDDKQPTWQEQKAALKAKK